MKKLSISLLILCFVALFTISPTLHSETTSLPAPIENSLIQLVRLEPSEKIQQSIPERSGCCSHHGGVCGCSGGRAVCCDGKLSPSCGCD